MATGGPRCLRPLQQAGKAALELLLLRTRQCALAAGEIHLDSELVHHRADDAGGRDTENHAARRTARPERPRSFHRARRSAGKGVLPSGFPALQSIGLLSVSSTTQYTISHKRSHTSRDISLKGELFTITAWHACSKGSPTYRVLLLQAWSAEFFGRLSLGGVHHTRASRPLGVPSPSPPRGGRSPRGPRPARPRRSCPSRASSAAPRRPPSARPPARRGRVAKLMSARPPAPVGSGALGGAGCSAESSGGQDDPRDAARLTSIGTAPSASCHAAPTREDGGPAWESAWRCDTPSCSRRRRGARRWRA